MYIKRNISWSIVFKYAQKNLLIFTCWATLLFCLYYFLELHFIKIPFQPLSVIGIAVSFYVGFKNNQSYDRFWEGRKIWGGIVNYSRTWSMQALTLIDTGDEHKNKEIAQRLIYRQIAWINALRVQLRQPKSWAIKESKSVEAIFDKHGERNISCYEATGLVNDLEMKDLLSRVNPATHLVKNQAIDVKEYRENGWIDGFQEDQLQSTLEEFYNLQGKCERIKNTPLPRQYAFFSKVFTWVFVFLVPLGMIDIFEQSSKALSGQVYPLYLLLMIPFSVLISWIFTTMEIVGDNSEDPFEGRINDVPMTALCRTIEIDLRDMLDEKDLPKPTEAKDNILY